LRSLSVVNVTVEPSAFVNIKDVPSSSSKDAFPTIVAVDKSSVEGDDNQFAYLSVGYTHFEVLEPILKKWMTV